MLSRWDQSVIAHAYGVPEQEIVADAQTILHRRAPLDDLLVDLCQRHAWDVAAGFRYLRTIRLALLGKLPR